jgi:hypothetical protein
MEGINNATGVVAALLVVVVGLLYKSQSRISELEAKLAKAPVNQKVKKDEVAHASRPRRRLPLHFLFFALFYPAFYFLPFTRGVYSRPRSWTSCSSRTSRIAKRRCCHILNPYHFMSLSVLSDPYREFLHKTILTVMEHCC